MTETEKKALALVNEACKSDFKDLGLTYRNNILDALLLAIERHETDITDLQAEYDEVCKLFEALRQEVSDAVESRWMNILAMKCEDVFSRFIISKPDPLVDAWLDAFPGNHIDDAREECAKISAALAARGLEIREKQP